MGRGAAVTMLPASTSDRRDTAAQQNTMFETFEPKHQSARYERARVWGLDCLDTLRWKQWEPGGTYVRSIILKNVSTKAIKVKYKLPNTRYFEMEFPEVIKLSPGMSIPVDVTFRPIKREQYDDFIEFKVAGCGSFRVRVTCPLPVLSLKLPQLCDLGYGAVNQLMTKTFTFSNDGDVALEYEWKLDKPFTFEPENGALKPGESAQVTCDFTPTDASVLVASAAILVTPQHDFHDGGVTCPFAVDVRAVGKYPFIRLSDKEVDFGTVSVGKTVEKTIRLLNQTPVLVGVNCQRNEKEHDGVFKCSSLSWQNDFSKQIVPQGQEFIRVAYTPSMPGTFSNERVTFTSPGGRQDVVLRVTGTAVGPAASLTVTTLQFGSIVAGSSVKRIFDVVNHSDVSMFWQINTDTQCTFKLDVDRGICPPGEKQRVLVTFAPQEAANYHKRLLILIRDAAPLALDVVGTCYDSSRRPAPMYLSHVETYRALCMKSLLAPGQPPIQSDREPFEEEVVAARADAELPQNTFGSFFTNDPLSAIDLDVEEVDFGACSRLKMTDAKTVKVTNKSAAKMTVFWGGCSDTENDESSTQEKMSRTTQKNYAYSSDAPIPTFAVFPEQADIRPGQTQLFRVNFRPEKDHKHYAKIVECFAYVKSMRSFRQVTEKTFTPPWCRQVRLIGHTFGPVGTRIGFMPKCWFAVANNMLLFPPTVCGEVSYQTVALCNDGDVSVGFEFPGKRGVGGVTSPGSGLTPLVSPPDAVDVDVDGDDADDTKSLKSVKSVGSAHSAQTQDPLLQLSPFTCFPTKGVVGAKSFQLIIFRFDAVDTQARREPVVCALNGSTEYALALDVKASGFLPKLRVNSSDSFVFKPTCVGAVATREVDVTNLSRINVLYEWAIPEKLIDVLQVTPAGGIVRGGETVKSNWTFCPRRIKKVNVKVPLNLRVPNSYEKEQKTFIGGHDAHRDTTVDDVSEQMHVTVAAEGVSGAIAMRPSTLDFGHQIVDAPCVKQIELVNKSGGVIRYRLETVWDDEECGEFNADVTYSEQTGLVPARAGKFIDVKFVGRHRQRVGFKINCLTVDAPFATRSDTGNSNYRNSKLGGGNKLGGGGLSLLLLKPEQRSVDPTDLDQDPPPSITVCGHSNYPSLRVRDVASVSVAKPTLWKQLSINALNKSLLLTPTPAEMKAHRLGGVNGSFASSRSMKSVQSGIAVGLGVGVEGDAVTHVYFELENDGALQTQWRLLLRNQVEVELENWVEIGEPENEVDAHQRFVVEDGIIAVTPRAGTLEPGQRQPVRISYAHDKVGAHWLTALLHIKDGRSIKLELGGRTLSSNFRCLDIGPANPSVAVHTFVPVTIGDTEPPAQTIELRNPTDGPVRYTLDLTKVEDLNAEAWDFPVLTCVERVGIVPARGSALVNWVFQPVEEKTYECAVGVTLTALDDEMEEVDEMNASRDQSQSQSQQESIPQVEHCQLTLRGAGLLPQKFGGLGHQMAVQENFIGDFSRNQGEWSSYTAVPTLPPTNDFALSTHSVIFGTVPSMSLTRRLVILKSHSDDAFNFKWDLGAFESEAVDGTLTIEPSIGTVDAHSTVFVKLAYDAKEKPQVFDGKITCSLTPVRPTRLELEEERRLTAARRALPETFAQHSDLPEPSMPSERELQGGSEIYDKIRNGVKNTNRMSVVHAATVSSSQHWPELSAGNAREHEKTIPPPPVNDGIPLDAFLTLNVGGRVVTQVKHKEDVGVVEYTKHFVPSHVPDAFLEMRRTRRAMTEASENPAMRLATPEKKNVLAGLLHDVLSDPSVRREFETLKREPPEYFDPTKAGEVLDEKEGEGDSEQPHESQSVLPDELDETEIGVHSAPASVFGSAAGWVGGDETGFPSDVDPREMKKASVNPEFRQLAEWTMEQTLFNLVKELHAVKTEESGFESENDQMFYEKWDSGGEDSFDEYRSD